MTTVKVCLQHSLKPTKHLSYCSSTAPLSRQPANALLPYLAALQWCSEMRCGAAPVLSFQTDTPQTVAGWRLSTNAAVNCPNPASPGTICTAACNTPFSSGSGFSVECRLGQWGSWGACNGELLLHFEAVYKFLSAAAAAVCWPSAVKLQASSADSSLHMLAFTAPAVQEVHLIVVAFVFCCIVITMIILTSNSWCSAARICAVSMCTGAPPVPANSKGWNSGCINTAVGLSCTAECDPALSTSTAPVTAMCATQADGSNNYTVTGSCASE
jgi:hypothetical protein